VRYAGAVLILAVVNFKGGTGKTTSAAFVAHALHELGERVLFVDADPQATAATWAEMAGSWPMPVVRMPSLSLHRDVPGIVVGQRYEVVVIDTPPIGGPNSIAASAMMAATHILVPVAPSATELHRLPAMSAFMRSTRFVEHRATAGDQQVSVLLTRTVAGAASTRVWRAWLQDAGYRVLRVNVARLERYAQAFGDPIYRADATAYGDVARELFEGRSS
jgi:chromosome partitioning protein